jgi:hypothetical protein
MPNRKRPSQASLKASRDAFKTLHADQERFQRNPGEAYIGLWRACDVARQVLVGEPKPEEPSFPVADASLCCTALVGYSLAGTAAAWSMQVSRNRYVNEG